MKEDREALIAQKRKEEKDKLKNHYGNLKFKPNKAAVEAYDLTKQVQNLAKSVDGPVPNENSMLKLLQSPEQ